MLPELLPEYLSVAVNCATYELLESGEYCAIVPGLMGVLARGKTLEECRKRLVIAVEDWVVSRLRKEKPIPPIGGCRIEASFGPDIPAGASRSRRSSPFR